MSLAGAPVLTFGEGLHNNHHRFPRDADLSHAWYEIDVNGLIILGLAKLGLVWDVFDGGRRVGGLAGCRSAADDRASAGRDRVMSKFAFLGLRAFDDTIEWLFSGPEADRLYGLSVARGRGGHFGFWKPVDAPAGTGEMPIPGDDTRELVGLVKKIGNPVARMLVDDVAGLAGVDPDDRAGRAAATNEALAELYSAAKLLTTAREADLPDRMEGLRRALSGVLEAAVPVRQADPAPTPAPGL